MTTSSTTHRAAGLAVVALALGAAVPSAAGAASAKSCTDVLDEGVTPREITTRGTSCATAKRLATRVSKVTVSPFNGCVRVSRTDPTIRLKNPCRKSGYSCRVIARDKSANSIRVSCRRGARNVRWTL